MSRLLLHYLQLSLWKPARIEGCFSAGPRRIFQPPSAVRDPSAEPIARTCGKLPGRARSSTKRLDEVVDKVVEIAVLLAQVLDLPDGVDHRRVVLAAEAAADLGQ